MWYEGAGEEEDYTETHTIPCCFYPLLTWKTTTKGRYLWHPV